MVVVRGCSLRSFVRHVRQAQISLEYLIIVGVAIALLIPGVYFFYAYSSSNVQSTTNDRLNEVGLKIVTTAKSVYSLGAGARETVEFVMPETVTAARLNSSSRELVFVYDTAYGDAEAVFFSDVVMTNLNATLMPGITLCNNASDARAPHPGLTRYRLESTGRNVTLCEAVS